MYVKLIQPKMKKRPMDTGLKLRMSPPLGLYTIANILRGEHRISVENENIQPINYDDNPDIVGITVTVDALPRAIEIAETFRSRGIPVAAGGIHITTAEKEIPCGCFDTLCVGMAEGTWPDLIKDLGEGRLKPVYRCRGRMTGADIVSPAYDLINSSEYLYCNIIHTSRGCPFNCDFCYNSSAEHQYLKRPIPDVINEIKAIQSRHVMFIDDNFTGDFSRARELAAALKPLRIKWNAAVSINIVLDPELLDLMKESGCQSLFIGFESIHSDSLHSVHKIQNDADMYEAAVDAIHSRGIMINASFVFGLDDDTPETFSQTLDWIVRHKIETVTCHILTPYPGTDLYKNLSREGRITSGDLSLYNTANVVFRPANMSAGQLYEGYLRMYKNVYSFKNIIKRLPRSRNQVLPYLMFNIFYRKFGRFTDFLCRLITYKRIGYWGEKLSRYFKTGI